MRSTLTRRATAFTAALILGGSLTMAGCGDDDEDTPDTNQIENQIDDTVDEGTDKVEDGADDAKDKAEDGADKAKDTADEIKESASPDGD